MLDPIVEIKAKLSIEDVVKDYVQLKRAGRNLKGLCPFHQEKTPSFMVSPDKGIAYCFGCHQGGDIFKFYMAVEKVDFAEALNDLAERVGVVLEKQNPQFLSAQKEQKNSLKNLLHKATQFFQEQLKTNAKAQTYLTERVLEPRTVTMFGLGYAPEGWHGLSDYLTNLGFSTDLLVQAGVAIADEQNIKKIHDKFRDRIMFPFYNDRGDIIGFTGRALTNENEPKYLNSPETILFHKSSFIYGLHQAKEHIRKTGQVYIVEGQIDCLQAQQNNFPNTVAVSGTAFTMQHLDILHRFAEKLIFVFDGDKAGKNAALRIMPELLANDINCSFALLPNDSDPDSLLRQDQALYHTLLAKPLYWLDYIHQAHFEHVSLKDPEQLKLFTDICLPLIKKLPKPLDQEEALTKIALVTGKSPHILHKALQKTRSEKHRNNTINKTQMPDMVSYYLAFCCQFPQFINDLIDTHLLAFLAPTEQDIYRKAHAYYSEPRTALPSTSLLDALPIPQDTFSLLLLEIEERYGAYNEERVAEERNTLFKRTKETLKKKQLIILKQRLEEARKENNKELQKQILAETAQTLKYT
ncbi:MAG: DNA primase [Candidatus Abawacabacteria bacterium]|nr:DNA primase [Candidatus Abawacabacteria bacterium]